MEERLVKLPEILRLNLHSLFFNKLVAVSNTDGHSAHIAAVDLFIDDLLHLQLQASSGSEFAALIKSYLEVNREEAACVEQESNNGSESPPEVNFAKHITSRANEHCMGNQKILQHSSRIGCANCLYIFTSADEISEWWEDYPPTGVCPKCGKDRLLGDVSGFPVTRSFLKAMSGQSEDDEDDWRTLSPTVIVEFNGEDEEEDF